MESDEKKPRPRAGFLQQRTAAAYVCCSLQSFDRMVKEGTMPKPVRVNGEYLWKIKALDRAVDDLTVNRPLRRRDQTVKLLARQASRGGHEKSEPLVVHILPDLEWIERKADLVKRLKKTVLSRHEIMILREFKTQRKDIITMFGYYGSFEALMARGLLQELARTRHAARPLVTYRLTDEGRKVVAAL
jgi:predicted DNA-binding transcriptional regulator AlpA